MRVEEDTPSAWGTTPLVMFLHPHRAPQITNAVICTLFDERPIGLNAMFRCQLGGNAFDGVEPSLHMLPCTPVPGYAPLRADANTLICPIACQYPYMP